DRTMRCTLRRLDPLVVFQHARLQPLLDQADDPSIADPVFHEPYQPLSADRVEERSDVGVYDPVDLACSDPIRQRVQRVVLAASRSEPIAKPQELRLVDRRQDRYHRRLDDLVLDGGDAERPPSAIRLRYIPPAGRQRPIRPCVDPCVEVCEVTLKMLRVLVPRYLVDAWGSPSLQAEERPPKAIDVDVVQERCQSLLPVPVNGLAYAALRL